MSSRNRRPNSIEQHRGDAMTATDTDRLSRTQESRAADVIHEPYDDNWEQDQLLNTRDIPAREGYVQRWIRTTVHGVEDHSNVQKKFNRGWRPRLRSTVPKGQFVASVKFQDEDVIGVQGMILMERPIELHERQRASIRRLTDMQMQSVKSDLYNEQSQNTRRHVKDLEFDDHSSVVRGRRAPIDD